jgi:hypothetical protein
MAIADHLTRYSRLVLRLPGAAFTVPVVKNSLNFVLRLTVDKDWYGRWKVFSAMYKSTQKRDVKDRVHSRQCLV